MYIRGLASWWDRACRNSSFTVGKWEASAETINVLDLTITKNLRTSRLEFATHFKPSARSIPLTQRSAHPLNVTKFWPRSELKRFSFTCSRQEGFFQARNVLLRRLSEHGYDRDWLMELATRDEFTIQKRAKTVAHPRERNPWGKWMITRFHPAWGPLNLRREIALFVKSDFSQNILQAMGPAGRSMASSLDIRVAWRKAGRHLVHDLRGD